jgi:hypothetical protein
MKNWSVSLLSIQRWNHKGTGITVLFVETDERAWALLTAAWVDGRFVWDFLYLASPLSRAWGWVKGRFYR